MRRRDRTVTNVNTNTTSNDAGARESAKDDPVEEALGRGAINVEEMSPADSSTLVATLAPTGIARQRVFGVLLRHLTVDADHG